MKVHVLTLFPRLFGAFLEEGMVGIAREQGALDVELHDYRDATTDRHRTVDDRPIGGGPGMVIKPEPVCATIDRLLAQRADEGRGEVPLPMILLTPSGAPFDAERAQWLADQPEWLVLCGRYEGFDERIHQAYPWAELSLGPYVLSGGEVPAMALIEASSRLIPGVLGDPESARQDSFSHREGHLDHPHYTRPREFRGQTVPDVLLSGDHSQIEAWRASRRKERTAAQAPGKDQR